MSESQPTTNRAEQRRNTHSEILAAAREAIGEHGFQSTTIRVIAQKAGVAVGTVMAHCGSKEELLFEVFHRDIDRMVATVLETVPDAPLQEQLIFVAESFLRGYAAEPEVSSEFLEHALWARGDWGQKFE
ncbi:MAG: TetR/AcrR family transcriptional regulator, partial [Planctomycetota bacterium]|nr:TetR/AcrR family transcriptional regulator [Planctomycetota bacterium]